MGSVSLEDAMKLGAILHKETGFVVGVPKEIKQGEGRVGLPPAMTEAFIKKGHTVIVEKDAGVPSGFSNEEYVLKGCKVVDAAKEVWSASDMIVKVKEPLGEEPKLAHKGQIVFCYFHFAASKELSQSMIDSNSTCIAYETLSVNNTLPCLIPMSEVAGKLAVQQVAKYLENTNGGRGVLLGGVPGVPPANVIVLGGGVVGTAAARVAAGCGAYVTLFDSNVARLQHLDEVMPKNVRLLCYSMSLLESLLPSTDAIIGAVLVTGAKAPKLLLKKHLGMMKKGGVVLDVAVDQGGCTETSRLTTHEDPVYTVDGIIHYCVPNMPGMVPHTSSIALANSTLKYALAIADEGLESAIKRMPEIKSGINMLGGKVVHPAVAKAHDFPYTEVSTMTKV